MKSAVESGREKVDMTWRVSTGETFIKEAGG